MSFNYNSIRSGLRVTITPHDLWHFTDGCHYTHGCVGDRSNCSKCPISNSLYSRKVVALQQKRKRDFLNAAGLQLFHRALGLGTF